MAIQEVPMYRVLCDLCGVSAQEYSEHYAWGSADGAVDEAENSDWHIEGGNHLCRYCAPTWRDDEEES